MIYKTREADKCVRETLNQAAFVARLYRGTSRGRRKCTQELFCFFLNPVVAVVEVVVVVAATAEAVVVVKVDVAVVSVVVLFFGGSAVDFTHSLYTFCIRRHE